MIHLYKAELKRMLCSIPMLLGTIYILYMNYIPIMKWSYGYTVCTDSFLFDKIPYFCIMTAILVSLLVGTEFDCRTINNKISLGFSKQKIYLGELLATSSITMFLYIIHCCSIAVFGSIRGYALFSFAPYHTFFEAIITLIILETICCICTCVVMVFHRRLICVFITVLLTFALLKSGSFIVSALTQPEYTDMFSEDHSMQPNPMYPKGKERFRDTAILTLSPFAQAEYATYLLYETHDTVKPNSSLIFCNFPYRLDFILIDAIECACITSVGIWIFGKQEHK